MTGAYGLASKLNPARRIRWRSPHDAVLLRMPMLLIALTELSALAVPVGRPRQWVRPRRR
jgi:hypothetical protein